MGATLCDEGQHEDLRSTRERGAMIGLDEGIARKRHKHCINRDHPVFMTYETVHSARGCREKSEDLWLKIEL